MVVRGTPPFGAPWRLHELESNPVSSHFSKPIDTGRALAGRGDDSGARPASRPLALRGGHSRLRPVRDAPRRRLRGLAACGKTHAAFDRRSIPAKQPAMEPARRSAGDPSRLNRVATRRSSLRFGRNTPGPVLPVGAPPSRALSAARLAGLGAHPGPTTGCYPRRCAPLIVAFRSKYTRASSPGGGSSLTRLVSRAPRPHRENWPVSALTWVSPQAARS